MADSTLTPSPAAASTALSSLAASLAALTSSERAAVFAQLDEVRAAAPAAASPAAASDPSTEPGSDLAAAPTANARLAPRLAAIAATAANRCSPSSRDAVSRRRHVAAVAVLGRSMVRRPAASGREHARTRNRVDRLQERAQIRARIADLQVRLAELDQKEVEEEAEKVEEDGEEEEEEEEEGEHGKEGEEEEMEWE